MVELGKPLMWGESETRGRFALPAGTVTFLLSDIEGSTRLWGQSPDAMAIAVADSYKILDDAIARGGGVRPLEQGEGDSVVAAFSRASDAVGAALDAQRRLHGHTWPEGIALRVRMALHTADAQLRDEGNYFGVALSRCARLRGIAHGGQTVLSHATHDLVVDRLPQGAELVDCGVHRLRDLGRPEHVYALSHPDLPARELPLRSLDAFPNNLPDQLTSFIGREHELDEINETLGETRLLTLTGAGGAGKTRLALQSAANALELFPDGTWWVELAALAEGELVGEALLAAIETRPLPGMSATEAACMRLADCHALLVLDNCEHLLAACAEIAEALLYACPEVSVLATSRTPLGVAGETEWRVPSLSLPAREPAREPVEALGQSDAVRLFIERARKARPNFAVNNDNAPGVAQICHALDGLPLAIELAAARVRMLSVDQIAAGLGDRFHLLTRGARTAVPRHQTLRASVDWSHELLSDDERILFRRLSGFAGGFTLDAVEDVCAGEGLERVAILDLLSSLVDKSLVLAEEYGLAVRYRLLETIREYALEQLLAAGEHEELRDRHRDVFLDLAEELAPELARRRELLDVLDAEDANIDSALDRAAQTDGELALRFCAALSDWWRLRGLYGAGERRLERALAVADQEPALLRAQVLCIYAWFLGGTAKYEAAIEIAQQALSMAEEVGNQSAQGRALDVLSMIQLFPDPVGSRPGFERACELAQASGDDWCYLDASSNLSWSYQVMCDEHDNGERIRNGMLAVAERGYRDYVSWYWLIEAWRPLMRGEADVFRERVDRALAAARDVGEPVTEATGENWISWLEQEQGLPEAALARLEALRQRLITLGAGLALPYVEIRLAGLRAGLGDLEGAKATVEPLIASGIDFGWALGWALWTLADILRVAGDRDGAEAKAAEGLAIAERISSRQLSALCSETLALVCVDREQYIEAEKLLHEALALRIDRELLLNLPRTLDALAEVAAGLESHQEAARILGISERTRADRGLVRWAYDAPRMTDLESAVRAALGEAAFSTAQDEGANLTIEEAIGWIRRSRGERGRPSRGWESLTPTELKIAELVAEASPIRRLASGCSSPEGR